MKLSTPIVSRADERAGPPQRQERHQRQGQRRRRRRLRTNNLRGQLAAINKAQAVIEFDLAGTVLDANENFLKALGYRLEESRAAITACSSSPLTARAPNISSSGGTSTTVSSRPPNTSGLARPAGSLDSGQLQSHPGPERQTPQGGEVRHRRHGRQTQERRLSGPDRGDRKDAGSD